MEYQPATKNALPSRQVLDNLLKRLGAAEQLLNQHLRGFEDLRTEAAAVMATAAAVMETVTNQQTMAAGEIVTLAEREKAAIFEALRLCKGDKLKAAARLGIGKTTLYRKLKEFGTEA